MIYYLHVNNIIFSITSFIIIKSGKLKLINGNLFSKVVKIMIFISDAQYYIPL